MAGGVAARGAPVAVCGAFCASGGTACRTIAGTGASPAAAPRVTDDEKVIEAGTCQFEARAHAAQVERQVLGGTSVQLHRQLGSSLDAGAIVSAGAAVQVEFLPRTTAFAERHRNEKGTGKVQARPRDAFAPERFGAFPSYGTRLGCVAGDGGWAVLGIRFNAPPLLR